MKTVLLMDNQKRLTTDMELRNNLGHACDKRAQLHD